VFVNKHHFRTVFYKALLFSH